MTEQPKSDVQLCCEALAAAQQVWLEHEQAQRLTGSGVPSEAEQLALLQQENKRLREAAELVKDCADRGYLVGNMNAPGAYGAAQAALRELRRALESKEGE